MMPFLLMIVIDAGVMMTLIYFLVPEIKKEGKNLEKIPLD
jgi:hypothetical protein